MLLPLVQTPIRIVIPIRRKSGVTITTTSTSNSAMNVAVTTKEASLIPQTNWTLKYVDSYNWYNLGTYAFDGKQRHILAYKLEPRSSNAARDSKLI